MDFSYSKFQKFVLILFYLFTSNGICSTKLYDFSAISGLIVFTIQATHSAESVDSPKKEIFSHYSDHKFVSLGEGTVVSNSNSSKPFTISQDATGHSTSKVAVRDPRILKDLSKLNRQGCLAKMLCGIEVAKEPSDTTTSWNDYAYLVKTFFDTFSFSGLTEAASTNDDESDPPPKRTRGDKTSKRHKSPGSFAVDLYREQSLRDRLENERIQKMREGVTLEELLDVKDGLFGKRTGPAENIPKRSPQIKNPRFDKTMYLDRKQREFSMATDEAQKMAIAKEVGNKFRRGRQCRALFNTGFSFCPWEAKDLQDLLLNKTTYTSSLTTTTTQRSYTLADSPYLYDSYAHLLEYQDDEFPTAFVNPSTILVETDAGLEVQPNGSEGKGFLTYDPNTNSNVFSYTAKSKKTKSKTKKQRKKKPKPESKETSRESSEETRDIDSGENAEKKNSNEEHEESIENTGPPNSNLEHDESTSDEDPDSVESQDDEEEDYKTWSESKESTTEKPKRTKTRPPVQKRRNKYSVTKEALKFQPTKFESDYVTVAQNFFKPSDRIISQERYLTGLPSVWDSNKEKWKYPIKKQNRPDENKQNDEKVDEKSKESESSEEDEDDNEDNTKELEENHRFIQKQRRVPPPRPLIRFRIPKFRGRRSIDYYATTENEGYLRLRPLPPEISVHY